MVGKCLIVSLLAITGCLYCGGLTLEECELVDYVYGCYISFENNLFADFTRNGVCASVQTYIECLENVSCECNYTLSYSVGYELTYMHQYYETQKCIPLLGPLDQTKGVPCDKWGVQTDPNEGQLLTLALAEGEYVLEVDGNCTGVRSCYAAYDIDAALAVHNRNLTELCMILDSLVVCVETAGCQCDGVNDTTMVNLVLGEDSYYRRSCTMIKGDDMIPREDIKCHPNGTSVTRTVCHTRQPTYKCYTDFSRELEAKGYSLPVQCPALKKYIECTEGIACQCGLVRDWTVYQALTDAIAGYNRTGCIPESGAITIVSGIQCPDGSGTREDEDMIVIELAESPSVISQDEWCNGVRSCYKDLDKKNGVALFEKNKKQVCANMKLFYECLELTYCGCGVLGYSNTSWTMIDLRSSHQRSCGSDSQLSNDFDCTNIGSMGHQCFTDAHCKTTPNTVCGPEDVCACARGYDLVDNTTCVKDEMHGKLSYKCTDNLDCQLVPNSECGEEKFCACQSGYASNNGACIKVVKGSIGYRCSSNADCNTVANSDCGRGGVCSCQSGYQYSQTTTKCSPVSGGSTIRSLFGLVIAVVVFCGYGI